MDYPFICKSILLKCLPFPSILTIKVRIKWRDHLSSGNTFNLLSLFWCFYQHMHFNAINQFNKIMRLELPFASCGRAVQEAKCPGSRWESGLWTCLQLFLSSFSSFRFGLVSSAQSQPDLEPPGTRGAGASVTARGASREHRGDPGEALRSCKELQRQRFVWHGHTKHHGGFPGHWPLLESRDSLSPAPGVLHWHDLGWRRARKLWKAQPGLPVTNQLTLVPRVNSTAREMRP